MAQYHKKRKSHLANILDKVFKKIVNDYFQGRKELEILNILAAKDVV